MTPPDAHAPPSDHLLRTLAAVPPTFRVLDLGCERGRHTVPMLRLGFGVHACDPRPEAAEAARVRVAALLGEEQAAQSVRRTTPALPLDLPAESFDWIVAYRAELFAADAEGLRALLAEARRLLAPGGWLYLTVPAAPADVPPDAADAPPSGDGQPAAPQAADALPKVNATPRFPAEAVLDAADAARLAVATPPATVCEHGAWRTRVILRRAERARG